MLNFRDMNSLFFKGLKKEVKSMESFKKPDGYKNINTSSTVRLIVSNTSKISNFNTCTLS